MKSLVLEDTLPEKVPFLRGQVKVRAKAESQTSLGWADLTGLFQWPGTDPGRPPQTGGILMAKEGDPHSVPKRHFKLAFNARRVDHGEIRVWEAPGWLSWLCAQLWLRS